MFLPLLISTFRSSCHQIHLLFSTRAFSSFPDFISGSSIARSPTHPRLLTTCCRYNESITALSRKTIRETRTKGVIVPLIRPLILSLEISKCPKHQTNSSLNTALFSLVLGREKLESKKRNRKEKKTHHT